MQTGDVTALDGLGLGGIRAGRMAVGFALAVLVPAGVQALCSAVSSIDLATASLLQLTGAVVAALAGGIVPGLLAALWSSLLLNYFMVEPTGSLFIHDTATVVSLGCFVAVAGAVASVVHVAARRADSIYSLTRALRAPLPFPSVVRNRTAPQFRFE